MKFYPLALVILLCLPLDNYCAEPQEVNSTIKQVTVYLHGAQISRQVRINLQKGPVTLAFRDLPVNIDPQSIQAKGEGNFVILSIVHQVNYLAGQRRTEQVRKLQDSLKFYENRLALVTSMQSVMNSEEEMLNANKQIGSTEKGVVLAELKLAVDFYRSRLTEIKKEELRLTGEGTRLKEKIDQLQNQLNLLQAGISKPTSEILVNISCDENVSGNLLITYAVYDAGWIPAYDIRAKDILSPVQLFYNARVYQNTGEPWDKVNIKLSTANPQQRGEKPNLEPWFIDFAQPPQPLMQYNTVRSNVARKEAPMSISEDKMMAAEAPLPEAETAAIYTEVSEGQTNLEFIIKIPYDIPSDNKQYTINIQDYSLPANYEYYCAPKLDRDAFLIARITGWEDYNLLSGEINLFFEGTYVGKSQLNVRNTNDTLELSLGRDKGIVVTRVKMKDYTEEKTIGSNKRVTRAWEITVRNTKKQTIDLRLEDQLPVSMNKDIEVEPLDYSGGKYNKQTGLITWRQRVDPSAEKKLKVSFAVKYPKDQHIYIE